jgi:hypothetical protein
MGYSSNSSIFYGIQVEELDWDTYDEIQIKLRGTPYDIRSTGSQATGPLSKFIYLRDSHFKISDNRYDHISHKPLTELAAECNLFETALEHEAAIKKIIEDMALKPMGDHPEWFVAAFGG